MTLVSCQFGEQTRRAIVAGICVGALALAGCQRESQPSSQVSSQQPSSGAATAGPVDVRALVPAGYAEPDRTWVPPVFTLSIANQGEPRVLVVSGWRGPTPFEVSVFANNNLVASRTFQESLFEMSVDLPAQSGPVTAVSIATTPTIGPDQRDQRVRGFVVRSLEVRPESTPSL